MSHRVLAIHHVETCLDGTEVVAFDLDAPVDAALVQRLAAGRELQRLADLPRPFYRIRSGVDWECKGIEGESSMRVLLKRQAKETQAALMALLAES